MQRWIATDIQARAQPARLETLEKLANYAAWLDVRSRSGCGSAEDRDRAAEAALWVKYWQRCLCSPSTTAFILACAEDEIAALIDGARPDARSPD